MTNLEAIYCEGKPYCTDEYELEFEKALLSACKRAGVTYGIKDEYTPDNERVIALAAIFTLQKYITLTSEKEGEYSQSYNDKLKDRILFLCKSNGIDASEFAPDAVITLSHASNMF